MGNVMVLTADKYEEHKAKIASHARWIGGALDWEDARQEICLALLELPHVEGCDDGWHINRAVGCARNYLNSRRYGRKLEQWTHDYTHRFAEFRYETEVIADPVNPAAYETSDQKYIDDYAQVLDDAAPQARPAHTEMRPAYIADRTAKRRTRLGVAGPTTFPERNIKSQDVTGIVKRNATELDYEEVRKAFPNKPTYLHSGVRRVDLHGLYAAVILFKRILAKLPDRDQHILMLHYAGFSQREIGAFYGNSQPWLCKKLARIKKKMAVIAKKVESGVII